MDTNNKTEDGIKLILPGGSSAWEPWAKIIAIDDQNVIRIAHAGTVGDGSLPIFKEFSGIVILPLFAAKGMEMVPFGLDVMKYIRIKKENYTCTPLFLVPSAMDIPPVHLGSDFISGYAKEIMTKRSFGSDLKAVFFAELIKDPDKKSCNVLKLSDQPDSNDKNLEVKTSAETLSKYIEKKKNLQALRKSFYNTFINYYEPFKEIEKKGHFSICLKDFKERLSESGHESFYEEFGGKKVTDILTLANDIYNRLNGISPEDPHKVKLEVFRAPIPFPLHELVNAENEIWNELKKGINFLLVDNKIDKVRPGEKGRSTLADLFQELSGDNGLSLGDLFKIQMLGDGDSEWTKISESENRFKGDDEIFVAERFRKELNAYTNGDQKHADLQKFHYLSKIYNRINKAHFILLDFFLNTDNTYLAFDFISDIAKIKRRRGDISTTWYFITSAVYDSVVKYSQSGLLAEYYESAVVSAGDDPTNEKRRIIFIYKLLTFIQARVKSFEAHKNVIEERLLYTDEGCPYYKLEDHDCGMKCLNAMLTTIRRFLNEYDAVYDLFYSEDARRDIKRVHEILENIIKHFMWLPEAGWPSIQRQIDLVDNYLGGIRDFRKPKRTFSCTLIRLEMDSRSEIY